MTTSSPRLAHNPQPQPVLLYTRAQAAYLLNCSVATLTRAEARGDLRGVRLNPTGNGKVYYSAADVHALAKGSAENRTTHRVEVWLEGSPDGTSITPPSNKVEQTSRKTPSLALLDRIAAALAARADNAGYPFFRDDLSVLIRKALAEKAMTSLIVNFRSPSGISLTARGSEKLAAALEQIELNSMLTPQSSER